VCGGISFFFNFPASVEKCPYKEVVFSPFVGVINVASLVIYSSMNTHVKIADICKKTNLSDKTRVVYLLCSENKCIM